MNSIELKIYRLWEDVELPKFGTEQSACFDLKAYIKPEIDIKGYGKNNNPIKITPFGICNILNIQPQDRILVPTGLVFDIPEGYSVRLHPRSGLAYKQGLALANMEAIIDSDYYHQTFVLIINTSDKEVIIKDGDRIAQGELVEDLKYKLVETKNEPIQTTDRIGGLGSTGV